MLTLFFSSFFVFFFYLVLALLFSSFIFFEFGVWNPKVANPKLGDRPQLWPLLPPALELRFKLLQ